MNYFHDGYYSDPAEAAATIKRWHAEGWTVIAIIPPGLVNEHGQPQGLSVVWAHPTDTAPPWER